MMNRLECLKILAKHVTDEIVVATYSTEIGRAHV